MLLSFLNDWWLKIVVFVRSWDPLLFGAMIALLAIAILVAGKFILKYGFNVNVYKKNLTFPIIMIILFVGLIVMLCFAYL